MDHATARLIGPYLRESLYREAAHRGIIRHGQELALDVQRAGELFGLVPTGIPLTRSEAKRLSFLLAWIRDDRNAAWSVRHEPRGDRADLLFLKPATQKELAESTPPGGVMA